MSRRVYTVELSSREISWLYHAIYETLRTNVLQDASNKQKGIETSDLVLQEIKASSDMLTKLRQTEDPEWLNDGPEQEEYLRKWYNENF